MSKKNRHKAEILEQGTPSAEEKQSDEVITVVLTSDNHLGYTAFGQHSRKREEREQRLRRAFQQATDFAIGQGVDLFIQVGDLFDTPTPDERDRSFVAERLAQLKQAGIRTFALGGVHDTPAETSSAPQMSYARLGALHYFPPRTAELEPALVHIKGIQVGICGLGVLADQEGDPLAHVKVGREIERAQLPLLLLHAPIEGMAGSSPSLVDTRAEVSRSSIEKLSDFRFILAGYTHAYRRQRIGSCEVIVAGSTQHIDFGNPDEDPGFVFLGLASDGIRWCEHIAVDTLTVRRLVLPVNELWPSSGVSTNDTASSVTNAILERLRPLCAEDVMLQVCFEGEMTRSQYHQLDLNRIRRYGEEECFALAFDESNLVLLSESDQETVATEIGERLSPRSELILLADEWIAATNDDQEKKALAATKEELLLAIDDK
ncbi:MAG: metallophosphoesterase [Chloroflexota bacterium]|nr:metallophosphoesterase [Chloroflexota bacterium]